MYYLSPQPSLHRREGEALPACIADRAKAPSPVERAGGEVMTRMRKPTVSDTIKKYHFVDVNKMIKN